MAMRAERNVTERETRCAVLDLNQVAALAKYQDLVVGSRSLLRLIAYQLVVTLTSWVPGALGLVLRRVFYPMLLRRCVTLIVATMSWGGTLPPGPNSRWLCAMPTPRKE